MTWDVLSQRAVVKEFVLASLFALIVVWTEVSIYGIIQAIGGIPLPTEVMSQRTLESVMHYGTKWALIAVPLALIALVVKTSP